MVPSQETDSLANLSSCLFWEGPGLSPGVLRPAQAGRRAGRTVPGARAGLELNEPLPRLRGKREQAVGGES